MIITNSRLRAFRRCPRFHQIMYELCVRPIDQSYALRFGTLIHLALEAWWKAITGKLIAAIAAIRAGESDEFDRIKAECLIEGYHHRWHDEDWEPVVGSDGKPLIETEFSIKLVHPATGEVFPAKIGGKWDGLVRKRSTGDAYVLEHKSSSEDISPGSAYWQRLTLDSQVSTYLKAAENYDPSGVLYDVLLRPSLEPRKATPEEKRKYTKTGALYAKQRDCDESPEDYRIRLREDIAGNPDSYYQRGTVVRTEKEETEAAFDLWSWSEAVMRGGHAPRNTEACKTVYGTCQYISVCTGVDSLDNVLKFRKAEQANEELSA